ncbi:MAG TPA: MarR family winged helix-turn-helix transcriptional regulator [Labilithrix sp.]|jgi:DNA-binding MarR family transcriptional regulator|nr:MarR family winged helix-turn-helix transcriptional regulator [Labilithrix sp.]
MEERSDELRRVMQRLFRRFGALAAGTTPCGKPLSMAHAHALMVLMAQGELSQQELLLELGIDKSNVARLCAKMVEVGHAKQRVSDNDGRSRLVSLTARGARLAAEVDAASRARFGALLGALPAARRAHVIEALQLVVDALDVLPAHSLDERTSE